MFTIIFIIGVLIASVESKLTLNTLAGLGNGAFRAESGLKVSAVTWNHAEISPTLRDCQFLKCLIDDDLIMLG